MLGKDKNLSESDDDDNVACNDDAYDNRDLVTLTCSTSTCFN